LQLLFRGFRGAPRLITSEHGVHKFPVVATPGFEAILNGGGIFADDADV
jgi:hypothetical protein